MPFTGKTRRILLLPAIILLITGTATAQRYSFRTYSDADGLTDLNANSIYQDHDGFLWVASSSGVFRFDGRHFRRYSVTEGLPGSLALSITENSAGELLADTSEGVGRLDGDRFVKLDIGGRTPDRCVQGLVQDGDRTYVATSSGLYWWSARGQSGIVPGTEGQAVWAVLPHHELHHETAGGNIVSREIWYSLDAAVCARRNDSTTRCYSKEDGLPAERWGGIAIDNDDTLWVRSSRHLLVLKHGAPKFEARDSGLAVAARAGAISLDSRGMPMVPTEAGLARWNGPDNDKPWTVTGLTNGLVVPSVAWAMEDREGSIWVGTIGGGLARWLGDGEWEDWTSQQGLTDDVISAVARDRHGRLLIGTSGGMNSLESQHVGVVPIGSLAAPGNRLRGIAVGEGNSIWLGTSPEGLGRLDTRTGRIQRFDASSGLSLANVTSVMVDHTGAVWVGGAGVFRGVRRGHAEAEESWNWQRVQLPSIGRPGASDAAGSKDIFSITEDRAGRVWFGTSRGLSYWDGQHAVRLGTAEGIPGGSAGGLAVAADGSIWIAINDVRDLYHIVPASGRGPGSDNRPAFVAQRFPGPQSAAGGGPNYFLGFDAAGSLWRGSDMGVDVYRDAHWTQITRADGLSWNTSSRNAFLADPDGSVWIGTSHGLSHHLSTAPQLDTATGWTGESRALIVRLEAGGRDIAIAGTPGIDYHAGNIEISFASPVFRRANSNTEDGFRSRKQEFAENGLLGDMSGKVKHQPSAFRVGVFRSSEGKVERVSELRLRRVSERFRLDVRDSTRDQCRRELPLRNPFKCKR
jgi:ligand-binding sensor domain-containing protein